MADDRTIDETGQPGEQAKRRAEFAPETYNAEQDDEEEQAQEVAEEALRTSAAGPGPTESEKVGDSGLLDDSTQDIVDLMRGMESSGIIDEHAYDGERNDDDDVDKYGEEGNEDDLPGDGS